MSNYVPLLKKIFEFKKNNFNYAFFHKKIVYISVEGGALKRRVKGYQKSIKEVLEELKKNIHLNQRQ